MALAIFIPSDIGWPVELLRSAHAQGVGQNCGPGATCDANLQCDPLFNACQPIPASPGPTISLQTCAGAGGLAAPQPWQVTRIIVNCVDGTIRMAVLVGMTALSTYMMPIALIIFILAVSFSGVRLALADEDMKEDAIGFLLRLLLVMAFCYNMGGLAGVPFMAVDEGVAIVSGGVAPWDLIDLSVAKLLGFSPQVTLAQGVLGVIGASLFSSGTGAVMFFLGFTVILQLLMFMYRAVYTYLLAVTVIGYSVFLSALVIPLAIFQKTDRYFQKWLDILLAAILVPIMLFAFLGIFMTLVNNAIATLFNVLGNDFQSFWRASPPYFSWMLLSDPAVLKQYETPASPQGAAMVQSFVNPLMGRSMNLDIFNPSVIDFGPDHFKRMQAVVLALVSFALTLYAVTSLLSAIPGIAEDIAGVMTGIGYEDLPMGQLSGALSGGAGGGIT
ncbi:MAG: type IV secretion system protein [Alphaproteobacteria bacterium]|nr:type IV secretion system protein [Alphaproteobacteria bacterium]